MTNEHTVIREYTVTRKWGTLVFEDDKCLTGPWEEELLTLVGAQPWPERAVFVDVGANQGLWTTFLAALRPRGTVFAFEPHPGNFRRLADNVARVGVGSVFLAQCALGDVDGAAQLRSFGDTLSHSLVRGQGGPSVDVLVRRFDGLILPPVDFVKIDAEFHEVAVLRGGLRCWGERTTLLVEAHPGKYEEVNALLTGAGYTCFDYNRHTGRYIWAVPPGRRCGTGGET